MEAAILFPPPEQIQERINLCRVELAELKRLLRASRAARKAEEARRARLAPPQEQEAAHVSC
jgi:hypothetical protein